MQVAEPTGKLATLDRQDQRQLGPCFVGMIDFVFLTVARQNDHRPLFKAERVQPGLLLVLEHGATTDRQLLQGSQTGGGDAGKKNDQQHGDQRHTGLMTGARDTVARRHDRSNAGISRPRGTTG